MAAVVSIRIGSAFVGMPVATGLQEKMRLTPPCGTTAVSVGVLAVIVTIIRRRVARSRYEARQATCWARRTATVPTPASAAMSQALSTAFAVTQGPGRNSASHVSQLGLAFTSLCSPSLLVSPFSNHSTFVGSRCIPWVE